MMISKNVLILNDTRRNQGHIGCDEVMNNIFFLCKKNGMNIIGTDLNEDFFYNEFGENFHDVDAIIINGEGTMHHNQKACSDLIAVARKAKANNIPTYLINTVWQDNKYEGVSEIFDLIFVRETYSLAELTSCGCDAKVVPDLSLYRREKYNELTERGGAIVIDSVKWPVTRALAKYAASNKYKFFLMDNLVKKTRIIRLNFYLKRYFSTPDILSVDQLRKARFVLTGRFHAMCLAMKFGVPFLCIDSNTHKIKGLLQDCGLDGSKYIFTENEINNFCLEDFYFSLEDMGKISDFVEKSQSKIEEMFLEIAADIAIKTR